MILGLLLRFWYIPVIAALSGLLWLQSERLERCQVAAEKARIAYQAAVEYQNARVAEWEAAAEAAKKRGAEAARKAQDARKDADKAIAQLRAAKPPSGSCDEREEALRVEVLRHRK